MFIGLEFMLMLGVIGWMLSTVDRLFSGRSRKSPASSQPLRQNNQTRVDPVALREALQHAVRDHGRGQ